MSAKPKSSIKKSTRTPKKVAEKKETPMTASEVKKEKKSKSGSRLYLYATVIIVILGLAYLFRGLFVVAVVNGKPITRYEVIKRLEAQGASSVVDGLVTETLINQAAKDANISVLPKDVDAKIDEINQQLKDQGQDLDTLLTAQGMDKNEFNKQVRLQLLVEKIFDDKIQVSDDEAKDYINQYPDSFNNMSDDEKMAQAKEDVKQQKLTEQFYTWIQDLKDKAKINYLVNY
jgi:parvulin-like peptidyl-prolyl isomerase